MKPMVYNYLILGFFVVLVLASSFIVSANPIPVPVIILEKEYINIEIEKISSDELHVSVRGVYPFENIMYDHVVMYFPIPREAVYGNITILYGNETIRDWTIVEKGFISDHEFEYNTVLGTLPMIKFSINGLKNVSKFNITVIYEYNIRKTDGVFETIYAMGTGRYYYSKQCTAYVTIDLIGLKGYELSLSLTPAEKFEGGVTEYSMTIDSDHDKVMLVESSRLFQGLERDLLIKVIPPTNVTTNTSNTNTTTGNNTEANEWVPSQPSSVTIKTSYEEVNGTTIVYVTIEMTFPHLGFQVDWGNATVEDNTIKINTTVLEWTGPSGQAVMKKTHTYTIVGIGPGDYVIELYINNKLYNQTSLTVNSGGNDSNSSPSETVQANTNSMIAAGLIVVVIIVLVLIAKKILS
ncbi:hypothetical protein J4526_06755 [Desulfurococcaceae archaeon MEX13E-LK6-19]|nr:hypothetical protein J4526_06755 [Desulfurococcaceae archaeon MEX13E-LK6-19]